MNAAPYTRLVWKEYRAIRGFWIALIALAVFMELLVLAFAQDRGWAIEFVYNIALGTPVFFAIGCIGTAYAIEKEDGTFDWLRVSPASDAQLFTSKVGLCLVATTAMFAILWLLTQTLLVAPPNKAEIVRGMLGLWLPAALEAIAWGLLFSLLSVRPLMAIILALFATSTTVHLLSWMMAPTNLHDFSYARYVAALPVRGLVLFLLVAADVYFGLRWLGSEERPSLLAPREVEDAAARRPTSRADVLEQLRRRDRSAMLGRLFWQHFRQSGRLMFTLATLQVLSVLLITKTGLEAPGKSVLGYFPFVIFAALMGANVFQADQQRHQFRFFVEHNVPPRYVWFTRLLCWTAVCTASSVLAMGVWLGGRAVVDLVALAMSLGRGFFQPYAANRQTPWNWSDYSSLGHLLPIVLFSITAIPAFAAGQWVSMFVRSGLLSGFFSLLLAGGLAVWAGITFAMELSWLLFLAPIPIILFWATWLRAPDWILEKTTWPSRLKAASVVLVPTFVLLAAAPPVRIAQVPEGWPGFGPAAYLANITPTALETGGMYRRANELYGSTHLSDFPRSPNVPELVRRANARVSANQEPLELILNATTRDSCALADPAKLTNWPVVESGRLVRLVTSSAYVLESDGKLDEALDRYFTAFTVQRQLSSFAPSVDVYRMPYPQMELLQLLTQWSAHQGQTELTLREAIARLEQVDVSVLNWEDALKSNYILCERLLAGDDRVATVLFPSKREGKLAANILFYLRLLPWEAVREQRLLNQRTREALQQLATTRQHMAEGGNVGGMSDPYNRFWPPSPIFEGFPSGSIAGRMTIWGQDAITSEVSFETYRRVTLITLACQAYRLKHGTLPEDLAQLREDSLLEKIPNDPLSGRAFVYFPQGIPEPRTDSERRALKRQQEIFLRSQQLSYQKIRPGAPCLWSPGLHLYTHVTKYAQAETPDGPAPEIVEVTYSRRDQWRYAADTRVRDLPEYQAWLSGDWFPIPAQK